MLNRISAGKANLASIFNLIMLLFMLCHWIACIQMVVEWDHYERNETSWIDHQVKDLDDHYESLSGGGGKANLASTCCQLMRIGCRQAAN